MGGIDRGTVIDDLVTDIKDRVVAMLGVCWSLEAMHDLVAECAWLIILETHVSAVRELEHFSYPSAVRILEPDMAAGVLAWNFFIPQHPVPPLLRALEDAELGRRALVNAAAFADGFEAAFNLTPPRGELHSNNPAFDEFDLLLDGGGRSTMDRAVEEGFALEPAINLQCKAAESQYSVRLLRAFPAWRCAVLNICSPFARVADHLVATLAAQGEAHRCLAAVFEVRRRGVRVVLRSLPGGPDVSEIAAMYDGSGRPHRAFFSVPFVMWDDLWVQPDRVLWDVVPNGEHCLALKRGDLVTVSRSGERISRDAPFDEWSWGYCNNQEGWIPTLAHTLLVAVRNIHSVDVGILQLSEGDLIVARGQRGQYVWGSKVRGKTEGPTGWFPYMDGVLRPVHTASAQALLDSFAGNVAA